MLGPSVLGWVHIDLPVQILAILGLAFLLFLAGLEIDLRSVARSRLTFRRSGLWAHALVLGVAIGAGLGAAGWTMSPLLIAIALSATSLGLVVPVLKDAGQADGLIGQTIIASATVADFAAIVLLTLFFYLRSGCRFNARAARHVRRPGCDCWPAADPGWPFDAPGHGAGAAAGHSPRKSAFACRWRC